MAFVRMMQRSAEVAGLRYSEEVQEEKLNPLIPPGSNSLMPTGTNVKNLSVDPTTTATTDGLIRKLPDGTTIIANIPTLTTHWYGDSWQVEVKQIPTDTAELNKLIIDLQTSSIALAARITKFDNSSIYSLNLITLTTGILAVVLTAITPVDTISSTTKQNVQIAISAITAGFSLFSNAGAKLLQPIRDQAAEYKLDVDEILTVISAPKPRT
jgi:hypothetical protein